MKNVKPTRAETKLIDNLVSHAKANEKLFSNLLSALSNTLAADGLLMQDVHSMKWRVKDSEHLRDKLLRKLKEAKANSQIFPIKKDNLFEKINDLAGFRILHLHTRQFERIDKSLRRILDEQRYEVLEGPSARTWDDESREYFLSIKAEAIPSKSLYTSVHYITLVSGYFFATA